MQTTNRLFDDLAKVASGAASTFTGMKSEAENMVKQQLQRLLNDADLVKREEFDAIKAVAIKAREEQEKLLARVDELEKKLATKSTPRKPRAAAQKTKTTRAKK